jgi:hypothetical protein
MKKKDYPPTPTLDKMKSVHDKSQSIGEFIDWLRSTSREVCVLRQEGNNGEPCYRWKDGVTVSTLTRKPIEGTRPTRLDFMNDDAEYNPSFCEWQEGYYPEGKSIEKLLAEYFEIDITAAENERVAVLEHVRSKH